MTYCWEGPALESHVVLYFSFLNRCNKAESIVKAVVLPSFAQGCPSLSYGELFIEHCRIPSQLFLQLRVNFCFYMNKSLLP